jgi:hypothetical protein
MTGPRTFQRGNRIGTGARGQLRSMITSEIIQQLNEVDPKTGRPKLHRLVENLIEKATTGDDRYLMETRTRMVNGKKVVYEVPTKTLVHKGTGDLAAIKEIFNRVDGKPVQTTLTPELTPDVPERKVYRTEDEFKQAMLARGIDVTRLPSPFEKPPH